ncbi:MAG: ABC transporter ATP-binding protein [Chloroflexota bacterium]
MAAAEAGILTMGDTRRVTPWVNLTRSADGRIVARSPPLVTRASSMPQTTIYVSPRSLGAFDTPPPAVVTAELARLFAGYPALAGVSLRVDRGRAIALLGPNGAGKTTLLRILATAIAPSFGRAEVDGLDIVRHPELVRPRVAYLSHATGLYEDLTGAENLAFAATMLGLASPEAEERRAIVLAEVGLEPVAGQRVRAYSAGMRRRLALGRLILAGPSLILLDEPYASLDTEGMQLVDRLLGAWREVGATVLVASHAVERLLDVVDGTVHLEAGIVARIEGVGVTESQPAAGFGEPVTAGAA